MFGLIVSAGIHCWTYSYPKPKKKNKGKKEGRVVEEPLGDEGEGVEGQVQGLASS
jgi:hypothetical protein